LYFKGKNKDCDFSFSGFLSSQYRLISKEYESESNWNTIVLNGVEKKVLKKDIIIDMCHIAQHTVSFQLSNRLKRALSYLLEFRSINLTGVVVSGGVASNLFIRHELNQVVGRFGLRASYPPVKYCTDNGVMIAWNGCEKLVSQSTEIVYASGQDENFFENDLKPRGKCPFGVDISKEIKILEIKIKRAQ
jgi:tRNA A37 threonylcarbamoyltransferase TsaD